MRSPFSGLTCGGRRVRTRVPASSQPESLLFWCSWHAFRAHQTGGLGVRYQRNSPFGSVKPYHSERRYPRLNGNRRGVGGWGCSGKGPAGHAQVSRPRTGAKGCDTRHGGLYFAVAEREDRNPGPSANRGYSGGAGLLACHFRPGRLREAPSTHRVILGNS